MGYESSILRHKVVILNKREATAYGETTTYEAVACVSSAVDFNRGLKALREGALDAYDVTTFRMRWNPVVKRDSRLQCEGVTYQIQSFHADKTDDKIQITATEIVNQ